MKKNQLNILTFFLLFSPAINIYGAIIKTSYITLTSTAVFGVLQYVQYEKKSSIINHMVVMLIISSAYAAWMGLANEMEDITWIKYNLLGIVSIFSSYYLVNKYLTMYGPSYFEKISQIIFDCVIIHSIIIIAVNYSDTFRDSLYSVVQLNDLSYTFTFRDDNQSRYSGLVQGGFGSLSLYHGVGLLIGMNGYLNGRKNYITIKKLILGTLIGLYAMIFVGRIGIVFYFIGLFLLAFNPSNKIINIKYIKTKILTMLSIAVIALILLSDEIKNERILWALELFMSLMQEGTLGSTTKSILAESLPEMKLSEIIFGTGDYDWPNADMGYLKLIVGLGLLGIIVSYMFLAVPIVSSGQNLKNYDYKPVIIMITVIIILANIKNLYYFAYNDIFQLYFLIFICSAVNSKKSSQ